MDNNQTNFRFWMPLNILEKGGDGNKKLKVGGIASTSKKDLDGESLDPNGFDLSYFKNKGIVNWNHNKSPDAVIGEPTDVKLTKDGLYVEAELYPDNPLAKSVYTLAETLQKSSRTRRLGFSIEGKAIERDENDKSKVSKALITNIALTISPKNPDSIVDIIKGNFNELTEEELKPYDYDFDYELETEKINKIEKALNTAEASSGKPLMKESVEGVKNQENDDEEEEENVEKQETLNKSIIIDRLMKSNSVITFEKANQIVEILNNIEMAKSKNETNITEDTLEKALSVLGVLNPENSEDLQKGANPDEEDDKKKNPKMNDGDNDEDDEEEEEEYTEKGVSNDSLKKSLDLFASENIEMFKGVGTLLKGTYDALMDVKEELAEVRSENAELRKGIEELSGTPAGVRKSQTRAIDRNFQKGIGGEEAVLNTQNVMSLSQNKPQVLGILDSMSFEKGFNPRVADAMTLFESSGSLNQEIIDLVKSEKGITLVK